MIKRKLSVSEQDTLRKQLDYAHGQELEAAQELNRVLAEHIEKLTESAEDEEGLYTCPFCLGSGHPTPHNICHREGCIALPARQDAGLEE